MRGAPIRRRAVLAGGLAVALRPRSARAQKVARVAMLDFNAESCTRERFWAAFRLRLEELGAASGRQVRYVDRVLKGAAPGDLAMEAPAKFILHVNVKTAEALELRLPPELLRRFDVVRI